MKYLILLIVVLFLSVDVNGQKPPVIKFPALAEIMNQKNDSTLVINFWATWCKPCVEELPYFLQLENEYKDKKVKFYYISLNFKREYDDQFVPFLENNSMHGNVLLLDEPDYNSWIDKVDPKWLGSIPATIIISHKPESRFFQEGSFTLESLNTILSPLIP